MTTMSVRARLDGVCQQASGCSAVAAIPNGASADTASIFKVGQPYVVDAIEYVRRQKVVTMSVDNGALREVRGARSEEAAYCR